MSAGQSQRRGQSRSRGRGRGLAGWVRYGFAASALAVAGAIFWFTNPGFEDGTLSIGGIDLTDLSDGLKLANPRFTGETAKGEPFTLSAAWALPDGPRPETVELNDVAGAIFLADGREVSVSAERGVFRPRQDVVTIEGDVRLTRSDGYEITASSARVDGKTRVLTADGPIRATSPHGEITAGSLRAERDGNAGPGDYIWFENRVHLRIMKPRLALER